MGGFAQSLIILMLIHLVLQLNLVFKKKTTT